MVRNLLSLLLLSSTGVLLSCGTETKNSKSPPEILESLLIETPNTKEGPAGKEGKQGPTGKEGIDGKEGMKGSAGEKGREGFPGSTGKDGVDGRSIQREILMLSVDRNALPWSSTNQITNLKDGWLLIPLQFAVTLNSVSTKGQLELKVAGRRYCYERAKLSSIYVYFGKKVNSATTDCTFLTELEYDDSFTGIQKVEIGQLIQIIPNDPKLSVFLIRFLLEYKE